MLQDPSGPFESFEAYIYSITMKNSSFEKKLFNDSLQATPTKLTSLSLLAYDLQLVLLLLFFFWQKSSLNLKDGSLTILIFLTICFHTQVLQTHLSQIYTVQKLYQCQYLFREKITLHSKMIYQIWVVILFLY